MAITIDQLPPEIQALLGHSQRSPVRAALTDLREPSDPKARINRPNFFFEMGQPEPAVYRPYPALRYKVTAGKLEERRADTAADDARLKAEGFSDVYPVLSPPEDLEVVQSAIAGLSKAEQETVLSAYSERRKQVLLDRLMQLSDEDFAALQFLEESEPAKRGPGRPPKVG